MGIHRGEEDQRMLEIDSLFRFNERIFENVFGFVMLINYFAATAAALLFGARISKHKRDTNISRTIVRRNKSLFLRQALDSNAVWLIITFFISFYF